MSNTLVENDVYTIRLQSGERELIIEHTFAQIEGVYAQLYNEKISHQHPLTVEDRANLCFFVAAMLARPSIQGRNLRRQLGKAADVVREMEEAYGIPPGTSTAARELAGGGTDRASHSHC